MYLCHQHSTNNHAFHIVVSTDQNILPEQLNIEDKELLDKLKKYEIVHPENVTPIANEFPDYYSEVKTVRGVQ